MIGKYVTLYKLGAGEVEGIVTVIDERGITLRIAETHSGSNRVFYPWAMVHHVTWREDA